LALLYQKADKEQLQDFVWKSRKNEFFTWNWNALCDADLCRWTCVWRGVYMDTKWVSIYRTSELDNSRYV